MRSSPTIRLFLTLTWGLAALALGRAALANLGVFQLNTEATRAIPDPAVASDAAGNFVGVWTSKDAGNADTVIVARRYDSDGSPRGDVVQVSARAGDQDHAAVASDPAGNFVVAWSGDGDGSETILVRCYHSDGVPLGDEIEVTTVDAGTRPALARDAGGNFVVLAGGYGRRYDPFGLPLGDPFPVSGSESVSSDAAGNFVVAWSAPDEDDLGVFARRYASDGQPQGDTFRVHTVTSERQWNPAVASDPAGNFVVTWAETLGGPVPTRTNDAIFVQRYDSQGQPLGSELRVDDDELRGRSPAVACDAAGNFLILWRSNRALAQIHGRRFSAAGKPQGVFRLEVDDGRLFEHGTPAVAANATGTFVAVVGRRFGWDHDVLARRLPPEARSGTFHLSSHLDDVTQIEGGYPATVTIWRTGGSSGEVSVDYLTVDGTATSGDDYLPVAGTLTFANGEWQSREVSLPTLEDELAEGNESFGVVLADPGGGASLIAPSGAEITILDDDFGPPGVGPEPLGPAFRPGDEAAGERRAPAVATAANGDFVVVWESRDGNGDPWGVSARYYDGQGIAKAPAFRVSTAAGTEPAVASDADGNVVVAWRQPGSVRARRLDSVGEALGEEFEIAADFPVAHSPRPGLVNRPNLARLGDGTDALVWEEITSDLDGFEYVSVLARRFDQGGAPLGESISLAERVPHVGTSGAAVAANPADDFVISWALAGVEAKRFDRAGMAQGEPFQVDADGEMPAIAMDQAGNFVVVWDESNRFHWDDVAGRRYRPDGIPRGAAFRVNRSPAWSQRAPAVASDAAGNFTVVWESERQDGSGYGIFGQRFDARGQEVGGEFLVNTATFLNQWHPAVASDPEGNLVVVWETEQDDGRFDVVVRRYAAWGCTPGPTSCCLGGGRFRIEVAWEDFAGHTGQGQAVPLTADTGAFWFFDDANLELVVKVLDGIAVNNHYWVFYGALSNVEYTITVTDTATGRVKVYFNPLGEFGSRGDTAAFPEPKGTALATHQGGGRGGRGAIPVDISGTEH